MRVLFFHAFHAEADLLSSYINLCTDHSVTPISPHRPPSPEMFPIDAVIVSRLSIQRWWAFESVLSEKFEVPRIVACSWPQPWSPEILDDLGLDGWVHLDLTRPPWQLMNSFHETISHARTLGSRSPKVMWEPSDVPLISDITRGDDMNVKILTLLGFGLSDRDIGNSLCLAPHTIRNRISRMLGNSGFESRNALSLYFLRQHRLDLQRKGLNFESPAPW